jgi:hypothetical protein
LDEEKKLLIGWREKRISESFGDRNCLLFATVERPFFMLANAPYFTSISSVMRQVAGDNSLKFHHLRHSAANWFFLRLHMLPEETRDKFNFLTHEFFSEEMIEKLRRDYLGSQVSGRNLLYATAVFLGHASPSTTTQNYLHFSDWLLGMYLVEEGQQPPLSLELARSLSGLKTAQLYSVRNKRLRCCGNAGTGINNQWIPSDLVSSVRRRNFVERDRFASTSVNRSLERLVLDGEAPQGFESWQQVAFTLQEYYVGRKISTIARRRQMRQAELVSWIERADQIRKMRSRGIHGVEGRLRHVWDSGQERSVKFPPVPTSKDEQETLTNMWNSYHRLSHRDRLHVLANTEIFLQKYTFDRPFVSFENKRQLKNYLNFLRLINVPKELIYISVLSSGMQVGVDSERVKSISEQYGVESDHVIEESRSVGKSKGGTLAIKIGHLNCSGRFSSSSAFRSFVYLCAIVAPNGIFLTGKKDKTIN